MTDATRAAPGARADADPGIDLERRALSIWPRLSRADLRRCGHDPERLASLVARRTSLPRESIIQLLTTPAPGRRAHPAMR